MKAEEYIRMMRKRRNLIPGKEKGRNYPPAHAAVKKVRNVRAARARP
jgi:hypothetical protein